MSRIYFGRTRLTTVAPLVPMRPGGDEEGYRRRGLRRRAPGHHLAYRLEEGAGGERLLEHHPPVGYAVPRQDVRGIARHVDHGHIRPPRHEHLAYVAAAEAGHHDVGEHQVDAAVMPLG